MRIVSLCPSISETLIDLGLAESLVGVTRFCIHPAEVVAQIPKVGGTKTPNLEAIAALAPDLIFMNEEENRREDFLALSARFRCETSLPKTVADVPAQLRRFGALTGTEARAEARAREVEAGLELLARGPRKRFRYAYLIWRDPWMTVNADTYVSDLLARAGGENVFGARAERYPTITTEALQTAAPDRLLLPDAWSVAGYGIGSFIGQLGQGADVHLRPSALVLPGLLTGAALLVVILGLAVLLLRGSSRGHRLIAEALIVLLIGLPFVGIQLVADVNRGLDASRLNTTATVERCEVRVSTSRRRGRNSKSTSYHLWLRGTDAAVPFPDELTVTSSVCNSASAGAEATFVLGRGALGHRWIRELSVGGMRWTP